MEPNLAESIYVRSSIKYLHFVLFCQQIWPPRAILVSDWLLLKKILSSETAWPNGAKPGRKHLCKVLYKTSSFGSIWPTNMAAKSNSCYGSVTSSNLHHIFMSRYVSQLLLEIDHLYLFNKYIVRYTCQSARSHLTLTSFSWSSDLCHIFMSRSVSQLL